MNKVRRLNLSDITFGRMLTGIKARINEFPHTISWNFGSSSRRNQENILKWKGIHSGKRCFIIANGPSILRTDLSLLNNEFTFGMNRIYLNFQNSAFRPTYYVTVNELILEQCADEITQLSMPKFLNWNRRAYFEAKPDIVFLKSKMVLEDFFQFDLTRPIVFGATVTFVALQLAYYMGFQKVILVGLDHQYSEKGTPSKIETRKSLQDESHFHPQYFPPGFKWQLPDLKRSEIEFELSRKAYESDHREILDATINGNCAVFKKTDYSLLF